VSFSYLINSDRLFPPCTRFLAFSAALFLLEFDAINSPMAPPPYGVRVNTLYPHRCSSVIPQPFRNPFFRRNFSLDAGLVLPFAGLPYPEPLGPTSVMQILYVPFFHKQHSILTRLFVSPVTPPILLPIDSSA